MVQTLMTAISLQARKVFFHTDGVVGQFPPKILGLFVIIFSKIPKLQKPLIRK